MWEFFRAKNERVCERSCLFDNEGLLYTHISNKKIGGNLIEMADSNKEVKDSNALRG